MAFHRIETASTAANQMHISIIHLLISVIHLQISINQPMANQCDERALVRHWLLRKWNSNLQIASKDQQCLKPSPDGESSHAPTLFQQQQASVSNTGDCQQLSVITKVLCSKLSILISYHLIMFSKYKCVDQQMFKILFLGKS